MKTTVSAPIDVPLQTLSDTAREVKEWLATQPKPRFTAEDVDRALADFERADQAANLGDQYAGMERTPGDRVLQPAEQAAAATGPVHRALLSRAQGALWSAAAKDAEAQRSAMHPVAQFLVPLKGQKVSVADMQKLEDSLWTKEGVLAPFSDSQLGRALDGLDTLDVKGGVKEKSRLARQFKDDPELVLCQAVMKQLAAGAGATGGDALAGSLGSPLDALYMLKHLQRFGVDGGELRNMLEAFADMRRTYVDEPQETKVLPDGIMKALKSITFGAISLPVLKGIALLGPQIMKSEIDPSLSKFLSFVLMIQDLSKDTALYDKLYKVCRLPVKDGTDPQFQYPRIVNLIFGLTQLGANDTATQMLDMMLRDGKADFAPLARAYLKRLAVDLGQDPANIALEDGGFNLKYVHLLPTALHKSDEKLMRKFQLRDQLEDVVRVAFAGNYGQWLHDPSTEHGRANLMTKEAFTKHGLDYDVWLGYSGRTSIDLPGGGRLGFNVWERNLGRDLFQGTYAQSCAALNGGRGHVQIDDLQYTLAQTIEVKDESRKGEAPTIGNVPVYWASDKHGVFLVADTTQLKSDFRDKPEIRAGLTEFMERYAHAVAGKDVPIRLGTRFNRMPTADLEAQNLRFEILGETANDRYHLNSLLKHETFYALKASAGAQRLKGRIFHSVSAPLYTLSKPAPETQEA